MIEANIAEISKRSILSRAHFRCEVCGTRLGYEKDAEKPHFLYLIPPLQGGPKEDTNIAVLCENHAKKHYDIDKERLQEIVLYREVAEPDT